MKSILSVLFSLVFVTLSAQEYKRWSVGAEFGGHLIDDASATVADKLFHVGGDLRYNISDRFGVGASYGYDELDLGPQSLEFQRLSLEGTVNVSKTLNLRTRNVALLVNGGPAVIDMSGDRGAGITGGAYLNFRLSNSVALKTAYRATGILNQETTIDGAYINNKVGVNSVLHNASVGLSFTFGRGKKHADFYEPSPIQPLVVHHDTTVVNKYYFTNITEVERDFYEAIYFDHDSNVLTKDAMNALGKAIKYLKENPSAVLKIKGYASNTSSSEVYNEDLAKSRIIAVMERMAAEGIDPLQRIPVVIGKDFTKDEINHDLARRVELVIE